MISEEVFFGLAVDRVIAADLLIGIGDGRVETITPNLAGLKVRLPNARRLVKGAPRFYLLNLSPSFTLDIVDFTGGALISLAPLNGSIVGLVSNLDTAGTWQFRTRPFVGIRAGLVI